MLLPVLYKHSANMNSFHDDDWAATFRPTVEFLVYFARFSFHRDTALSLRRTFPPSFCVSDRRFL